MYIHSRVGERQNASSAGNSSYTSIRSHRSVIFVSLNIKCAAAAVAGEWRAFPVYMYTRTVSSTFRFCACVWPIPWGRAWMNFYIIYRLYRRSRRGWTRKYAELKIRPLDLANTRADFDYCHIGVVTWVIYCTKSEGKLVVINSIGFDSVN